MPAPAQYWRRQLLILQEKSPVFPVFPAALPARALLPLAHLLSTSCVRWSSLAANVSRFSVSSARRCTAAVAASCADGTKECGMQGTLRRKDRASMCIAARTKHKKRGGSMVEACRHHQGILAC